MKKLVWTTVQKRVKDLLPFKQNPRYMSEEKISELKKSIQKYNLVDIPAIDVDNRVISGHQRLAVLQLLNRGDEMIDCRIPNRKLSEEEYKQYMIISNKLHGEFDEKILFENFDTDILLNSGFDKAELSDLYSDILDTEDDNFDEEAELKKIRKPKSKFGEIYQLGPHRVACSDATDLEAVKKLVGDSKIDLIYCDPVYNRKINYREGLGGTKNYHGEVNDDRTDKEYEEFLRKTMSNALAVSNKDVHMFYYCDQIYVPMVAGLYKELGVKFQRICLWLKGIANPVPQVAFSKVYEPTVYGSRGKPYLSPNHRNFDEVLNKDIGTGHEMIENFMSMIDVWAVQRLPGHSYLHATMKPVTLSDKPIKRCTKVNDNILSLFGGSSPELISAHQLKRNCFVMERSEHFVDLIIKRFESATGIKAKKINL